MKHLILKKKRGAKCPFLKRFITLAVAKGNEHRFVPTEDIFREYCAAVPVWTEDDSLHGQTKYLMKKTAFYEASITVSQCCQFCSPKLGYLLSRVFWPLVMSKRVTFFV